MPFIHQCRLMLGQFCAAGAVLLVLCLPAWSATACTYPPGVTMGGGGKNFFGSFAESPSQGYEVAIPGGGGAIEAGDLNDTYFRLYYSIYNLQSYWMAMGYCPVELIIGGSFPDVRYFSITVNDMHKTVAQHITDAGLDPANGTYTNPFVPGSSGSSPPYTTGQAYLVPISLGTLPGTTTSYPGGTVLPACALSPFAEDNLLDATARHPASDWNVNVPSASAFMAPNILSGLQPHVVDNPGHVYDPATNSGPNTAGNIILRDYLSPPESCPSGPASCFQSKRVPQPYVIVRDTYTGCAYTAQEVANYFLYDPGGKVKQMCNLSPASLCPSPTTAVLSILDPSPQAPANWTDVAQQEQHSYYTNTTPEACYADGDPALAPPPPYANRVAWVRSPQWEIDPGPDDSYLGGAISTADLGNMAPAAAGSPLCSDSQGHASTDGCIMRFRFQLPVMPATPCQAGPGTPAPCSLSDQVQMRYTSLTFWYGSQDTNVEPIHPNVAPSPISIVSLADPAYAPIGAGNGQYVTLLVNTGANLPAWLQPPANLPACAAPNTPGCGVTAGVQPVLNSPASPPSGYAVWTTPNGYTVLDLTQFKGAYPFSTANALRLTIRNTLPNLTPGQSFNCSAAAVPFLTAEYTAEGGLMGPYAPLVDYVDPMNPTVLPQVPSVSSGLPPATACGVLPNVLPGFNAPRIGKEYDCAGKSATCLDWPDQFWPSATGTLTPPLNCRASSPATPQIFFAATQFPIPAITEFGQTECASQPGFCSQILPQSALAALLPSETAWQPPLPVTIVGSGFGYLPQPLPFAGPASSLVGPAGQFLVITDAGNGNGGDAWSTNPSDSTYTTACQVYVADWRDTGISLIANLPTGVTDSYQQQHAPGATLSALVDFSPLTLAAAPPFGKTGCPIAAGDILTFTVMNPQNGQTSTAQVTVSPATGTTLF
ncbi:MAG: hypothetical protein ABSC93_07715 [Bryobacteraceae bacterium]